MTNAMESYTTLKRTSRMPAKWLAISLIIMFTLTGLQIIGQVNASRNTLYITGQLTNDVNGAPIPDHNIYITSDPESSPGFEYYAVTKTDMNGFYYDTLVTTLNDGAMKIYTYDYENEVREGVFHFRFYWEDDFHLFGDLMIHDPFTSTAIQANFNAEPDSLEESPLEICFQDLSSGYGIQYWLWDFGDGNYSTEQNPRHHYSGKGIYYVRLTISDKPYFEEDLTKNTITKQVQVGFLEYYNMGGHVFAEYFPIDYGLAYLYALDEEFKMTLIDTARIDTLGYYYFYQVAEGYYVTKARLHASSDLYGQYMPTYFGNSYIWNNAYKIRLNNGDSWENDIHLIPSGSIPFGSGEITGTIVLDTSIVRGVTSPANNIEIVLLDNQNSCLTCSLSDVEGHFRFNNLAFGTYQIYPDVAGIRISPMFVTISEAHPSTEGLVLIIYNEEVTFSIPEQSEFISGAAMIFPNPLKDRGKIGIEMKKASRLEIVIVDLAGKQALRQSVYLGAGPGEISFDASVFAPGNYQVLLIPEDGVKAAARLLKVR
jgi:PKD repeat protein